MNTWTRLGALLFLFALTVGCGGEAKEPQDTSEGVIRYGSAPDDAVDWGEDAAGVEIGKADVKVREEQPKGPAAKPPKTPKKPKKPKTSGKYKVIAVSDGGTISGTVKFKSKPVLWDVDYNKDQEKCGHASYKTERVIFDEATLGVANCVVYLADISKGKDWTGALAQGPDERAMLLDQVNCRYVPHVMVLRPETQLQIKNSDDAEHNVHGYFRDFKTTQFNQMTAANSRMNEIGAAYLEKVGEYIVKCDVHAWMSGYVHVIPNPYWVVTAKDGKFELKDVPPGTYTVVCWHEGMREIPQMSGGGGISGYDYGPSIEETQKVTVEAGATKTVDFALATPPKSGK